MTQDLQRKKKRTRLTPLGRFIVNLFLIGLFATAGAIVGYSIIGHGNPFEIFLPRTWIHLMEVLYKSLL
ncbi:DNA-directed RNA polymerase subunit beta [Bacillus aerolatus]|uniref:DNA-directed RNA polymerase subunit beta n=1 Tax=Bacillus aerolatus TaxID=2653354 RepID=A0A6I1FS31_9BACI|nr:DNA-directed RNA polymerase subunit beta [Bacillus aerolatus]KAB7707450.1 DNA-directed RNA polymerase subunit beta [Bacillus aerolatus]